MKRVPMTLRGAEALRVELKRLKSQDRPNVIKAITEARGHGDLSENAEYHAAREQQGFIEGRIKEIEGKLANAEVIEPGKLPNTGKVIFGAVVQLEDQDSGERVTYQVVGEDEADIRAGRISVSSPIARALVGKSAGEVVDVAAPGGTRSYEILAVRSRADGTAPRRCRCGARGRWRSAAPAASRGHRARRDRPRGPSP
jgi:transcription elongation factor GreA